MPHQPLRPWLFVCLIASLVLCASPAVWAAGNEDIEAVSVKSNDPVIGLWRTTDGDGVVELYACKLKICGRFFWLKDDSVDDVSRDTANHDPDKRNRPLCDMQFMGGFRPAEDNLYEGGWIYSPQSGATYSAQMKLTNPDKLELHGYMFTPMLGESRVWTRVKTSPHCETADQ